MKTECNLLPMIVILVHLKYSEMRLSNITTSIKMCGPAAGKRDDRPWPIMSTAKKLGTFSSGTKLSNVLALSSQPWSPSTGCTVRSPHHLPASTGDWLNVTWREMEDVTQTFTPNTVVTSLDPLIHSLEVTGSNLSSSAHEDSWVTSCHMSR